MLKIGLTGGIGAGKSTVARSLAEHGAVVIDADTIAREVVAPGTPGLAAVVEAFGEHVLDADGALDRPRLGSLVFDDGAARRRLNAIVHPLVRRRSDELMAVAGPAAIVVNDVPLLAENGLAPAYHLVIVVESPVAQRIDRLVHDRGMSEEDARSRLAAQASDSERRAVADVLLTNEGAIAELEEQVDSLWVTRISPFADNIRAGRRAASPQVVLSPYQTGWPAAYERLAARIAHAAGPLRIDHVGSTAVPGLPGKDVIDIQISVDSLDEADRLRPALQRAGFPAAPEIRGDRPKPIAPDPDLWQKRYHGAADPGRPAHLHLRVPGSAGWRYALLFRDWLRADPAEAAAYGAQKRRLAAEHPQRAAYAEAKEPWFDAALPRAEQWAVETGWAPVSYPWGTMSRHGEHKCG